MGTQERQLIAFLQSGKYSVMQIANALFIGDPRDVIRRIRKRGIIVNDEWRDNVINKGRHKIYWIEQTK